MWRYICYCSVVFSILKSGQSSHRKSKNDNPSELSKQTEIIFTDVIKNISRVNNVLQELINNYEQLQKIYNSQENGKSENSDSEIDEFYKARKGGKKRSANSKTTQEPGRFGATQTFWNKDDDDDNVADNSSEDSSESEEKDTVKSAGTIKNYDQESKTESDKIVKTTTTKLPETSSTESSENISDVSYEKTGKKPGRSKTKDKRPKFEILFDNNNYKSKEAKPEIEPKTQFVEESSKTKTRYSKVSQIEPRENLKTGEVVRQRQLKPKSNNQSAVKQVFLSELFSPKKIWNDIINNKPIQLEAHSEITMERMRNGDVDTDNIKSRKDGKRAIVVLTASKVKDNHGSGLEEGEGLNELKTQALREAYGDACMKLVVRKCYKACKKVSKSVCNEVKCKKAIKEAFNSYSKTGCLKEFRGKAIESAGHMKATENWLRNDVRPDKNADMTRSQFLFASCLPEMKENTQRRRYVPPTNIDGRPINILRDRFEKECKRVSSYKCNKACTFAYTNACTEQTCSTRMRKQYQKFCRTQCNSAYELFNTGSSGSYSDSDSGSGGSSSDESDES